MERIFRDHMSELYRLAFLLTGDRERSVRAFTGALNSDATPPAFDKFMLAWARRLVIVAALGTIRGQLRESTLQARPAPKGELKELARLASADLAHLTKKELDEVLLSMDVLPRCAVILTILEKIPVREAALLLGIEESAVKAAQARGVTEMTWRLVGAIRPKPQGSLSLSRTVMAAF